VAILQTTVGPALSALGAVPDAVLVLVVSLGLLRGSEEGMVCGLLGGLAVGLLSGAPLGAHALLLTPIGYIAGLGRRSPFRSRLFVPILAISGATCVYMVGMALLLRVTGWPLAPSPALVLTIVPTTVTNAVLMLVGYWWIARLVESRRGVRSDI
jgi:rod shape-determining protein MreD